MKSDNPKFKNIEFTDQFQQALNLMENTDNNIFITGKAGTGKSTLLEYFRDITHKRIVVLASTGVAAVNVSGETIHSFFGFKPDITPDKVTKLKSKDRKKVAIYHNLDTIVIDEISMVRADLLDCVDRFLRINRGNEFLPFGGIQMIFIGDLYQLPPVVTGEERNLFREHYKSPYYFDSHVFKEFKMDFIELEKIFRQKDEGFIQLLNSIRNNSAGEEELSILNKRYNPDFEPDNQYFVYLTTTNAMAADINSKELEKLQGSSKTFEGKITGDFDKKSLTTDIILQLKIGSQIMLLNNDSSGRWVNGTIGRVIDFKEKKIIVLLTDGDIVEISPFTWEIFHFYHDQSTDRILTEPIGTFKQYPLKLAWAITIHKSQGKSFDKVIIDIGRGTFAHGQLYVALSRCRTLDGIVLKKKILKHHIFMDYRIVKFVTQYQYDISEEKYPLDDKIQLIESAMKQNSPVEMTYLKSNDEKSKRVIQPLMVGEIDYQGKSFIGMKAYCYNRKEERTFRLDRILDLKILNEND